MRRLRNSQLCLLFALPIAAGLILLHFYLRGGECGGYPAHGDRARHQVMAIPPPEALANLPPDGGHEFNRLVFEKSPYLLQHARNPVDWFPWGEEAFEKSRREDKPIFLSIGYSTCHWCHVMERESFEDKEVAELLNLHFICIKVDREERPDVDQVYMTITQMMTGSGGWPMTVFMTPDKKPFYAGAYFPTRGRLGLPGMLELVPRLGGAWKGDRNRLLEVAENMTNALGNLARGSPAAELSQADLDQAFQELESRFDSRYGGFGSEPKFPMPHELSFLLRYGKRTGKAKALVMVEKTLTEMRLGGIYDQIGFGTHRYSTDRNWLVPHFEKMLYDQALLAITHIEVWQATGREFYGSAAREIFEYVLRDMTSPEGAFYSAEDADSEGKEGKFYLWTPDEIIHVLGQEEGKLFCQVFNIVKGGNFREGAPGRFTGGNIPHLKKTLSEIAKDSGTSELALRSRLEESQRMLLVARDKRVRPGKDDKILADWNGLMIAALARGGQALGEPRYLAAGKRAADFILANLRTSDGRLLKRYRQGEAGLPAHLEDYAFLVWSLLDLYEATIEIRYLREAMGLTNLMLEHYWDEKGGGGLFLTADDGEKLLVRPKEIYDGAIPSGNSVAVLNLLRLARATANSEYKEKAGKIMKAFSGSVRKNPSAHAQLMIALDFAIGPS